jgi:Transposase IS66 family
VGPLQYDFDESADSYVHHVREKEAGRTGYAFNTLVAPNSQETREDGCCSSKEDGRGHEETTGRRQKRKAEPNSGLGKAIQYLLRHWQPLTLFLRQAGAPVDNNLVERSLKRAVLHRKNALFYRTLNGAQVGDLFMSLIHTCQLCGTNSFDYLIALQRHAAELAAQPSNWMPWNYRDSLRSGAK